MIKRKFGLIKQATLSVFAILWRGCLHCTFKNVAFELKIKLKNVFFWTYISHCFNFYDVIFLTFIDKIFKVFLG